MEKSSITQLDFIDELRLQMLKFAMLQLGDTAIAEDAVQDALLSAYQNSDKFAGKAAFKTWVFAILKNKIIDMLRKSSKTVSLNEFLTDEADEDATMNMLFNQKGWWHKAEYPLDWGDPHQDAENGEFWIIFEACLEHLPANQAQVFMMREFIELDSHEICLKVAISESNLNVLMYRARLKLRECLENKWILAGECTC